MALIYITGAPGAGKTTLEKELRRRGFETHDMDDPDIGGAHDKITGQREAIPPVEDRPIDWFDTHEWKTSKSAIEELRKKALDTTIFLCGVAPDDNELMPLFDKVVYLDVDEASIRKRLAERVDNDYGKTDTELEDILRRRQAMDLRYKELGVLCIDGSQEPQQIADAIIEDTLDTHNQTTG